MDLPNLLVLTLLPTVKCHTNVWERGKEGRERGKEGGGQIWEAKGGGEMEGESAFLPLTAPTPTSHRLWQDVEANLFFCPLLSDHSLGLSPYITPSVPLCLCPQFRDSTYRTTGDI